MVSDERARMTTEEKKAARAVWDIWASDKNLCNSPNEVLAEQITERVANALREQRERLEADNAKLLRVVEAARDKVGPWISAALEDTKVCTEMKADIQVFFDALADLDSPHQKKG